jgi:hypothetical protein
MAQINEEDVILAFRQTLEEELKRAQEGAEHEPILLDGASTEENLERLAQAHRHLQAEVALLRTVILKLLSQPVDESSVE